MRLRVRARAGSKRQGQVTPEREEPVRGAAVHLIAERLWRERMRALVWSKARRARRGGGGGGGEEEERERERARRGGGGAQQQLASKEGEVREA